ncbi:recombinase family protein [Bacillus velezensis]
MKYLALHENSRIAVYSRKSREDRDSEDTLAKHRNELEYLIKRENFKNVQWFEEVVSGETIDERPMFSMLLPRIENGEFDAVCAVAMDRLSRGSQIDSGRILEAFKQSGTLFITPKKTYDLSIEGDEMLSEFESIIARSEYRAIKRRTINGKKNATREGRLHSGSVPYGYKWDKNIKAAVVVEEKKKIYRMMIKWFLEEEHSCTVIAEMLNELKVPSPSGRSIWYGEVVSEILSNDFHRGYVWFGKYKKSKSNNSIVQNKNLDEVLIAKGHHETMKTDEEHALILNRIEKLRTYKVAGRRLNMNTHRLSGIVRCPYCHKAQAIEQPKGRKKHVRKCLRKSAERTKECEQTKGIHEEVLFQSIMKEIKKYNEALFSPAEQDVNDDTYTTQLISLREKAVKKAKGRIERIKEMYLDGDISKTEYKEKLKISQETLQKAENDLAELIASTEFQNALSAETKKEKWSHHKVQEMIESTDGMSNSEINLILKMLISHVTYTVEDLGDGTKNVNIEVYYN